jgi:hypothetical protein
VYTDEEMLPGAALRGDWPGSKKKTFLIGSANVKRRNIQTGSRKVT